jgi:hypothetical protein
VSVWPCPVGVYNTPAVYVVQDVDIGKDLVAVSLLLILVKVDSTSIISIMYFYLF